ncbi:CBS domain-containing protein [Desulfatitalea alkaliphila]|uniref:Response regulator n=1 Tax=Desulfatitalea alkaliphila TaxID=2929485 RepID=A0AA41R0X0_9BACT|nr:response regulator [Desulfatitalea alkaliphila]MCJ8500239.1 response regulator [Desulfatitalea alkaliphila]
MTKGIRILMVDDEAQFRATTQKILQKKGFETIMAATGEEALEQLTEKPDVVVLDVKMPGMDGHEVLRKIKERQPDLPVIMLTGHGKMPSAKEALAQGAFDYLSKPCDIDLLSSKVDEAFRFAGHDKPREEKLVRDAMVPIGEYTTIDEQQSVGEAVKQLRASFGAAACTSRLMETGHRSIVVFDRQGRIKGVLAILDLLRAIMPAYLAAPKPSMADAIQYSPMFWRGAFNREVALLAKRPVSEIMSPVPETINDDANLMEAAYSFVTRALRRMVVMRGGEVVGILREQDLFFEIERVLRP